MKIFILLIFLLIPALAQGAVALIQSEGVTSSGAVASLGTTLDTAVTSGNALIAGAACYDVDACIGGVWSSTPSNTWALAVNSTDHHTPISYATNIASGSTTCTITPPTPTYIVMGCAEFSGVKVTSPLENTATNLQTTDNPDSGNVTISTAGVLFGVLHYLEAVTATADAAWSVVYADPTFTATSGSIIYRIMGAGTDSASWTLDLLTGNDWEASAAGFLEQPSAAGVAKRRIVNIQ